MRLIDADALIKDLEYDVELDAKALDDTDLLLGRNRELVQFDKDCKQNAIDMLKKAPTVDAVPVEWIKRWSKEPMTEKDMKLAEQCEWNILEWLIADWHVRKEE